MRLGSLLAKWIAGVRRSSSTCGYVLKNDYPDYLPLIPWTPNTFDAAEYLMKHVEDRPALRSDFDGTVPETPTS